MHGLPPPRHRPRPTRQRQPLSDQPSGGDWADPSPRLLGSVLDANATQRAGWPQRLGQRRRRDHMPTPRDDPATAGQVPTDQFLAHQMGVPVAAARHGHPARAAVVRPIARPCASTHDASPQRPPADGAEGREHAGTTASLQSQVHVHPHSRSADCSRAADGDAGESVAFRARPGRTRETPSGPFEETGARRPGHDRRAGHALLRAAGMHAWLPDRAPAHEGRHGGG